MGNQMTFNANGDGTARIRSAVLQIAGGGKEYVDFGIPVNKVIVFSDTLGEIGWRPSTTSTETASLEGKPTATTSPGAVTTFAQGYLYLAANVGEILETTFPVRYWHFVNHGGTTIVLRFQGGEGR